MAMISSAREPGAARPEPVDRLRTYAAEAAPARLLIVDDIEDNRVILSRRFARRGFRVAGHTRVLDTLLDHGIAGRAEFVDAARDGRHSGFQVHGSTGNSWVLRSKTRKGGDNAAMKVASKAPTKQRSLISRFRRRPSISERSPRPGQFTFSIRAHAQALLRGFDGDPVRAIRAMQQEM